jgi:hypothetical protein
MQAFVEVNLPSFPMRLRVGRSEIILYLQVTGHFLLKTKTFWTFTILESAGETLQSQPAPQPNLTLLPENISMFHLQQVTFSRANT